MPQYTTEGIVIGGRKFGEADSIVKILTPDRGKVSAIARGVRKGKSKFSGSLEPMMLNSFLLAEGKNLEIVCQVENIRSYSKIRANYKLILRGGNLLEAAGKLTEEGLPDPPCFALLVGALDALEKGYPPDGVELLFKVGLLLAQGVFPDMSGCGNCGVKKTKAIHFDGPTMSLLCDNCATFEGNRNAIPRETLTCLNQAVKSFDDSTDTGEFICSDNWEGIFDNADYPVEGIELAVRLADEMLSAFIQARVGRAGNY